MPLIEDTCPDMQDTCDKANTAMDRLHKQYHKYMTTMYSDSRAGMKLRGVTPRLYISSYLFNYLVGVEGFNAFH